MIRSKVNDTLNVDAELMQLVSGFEAHCSSAVRFAGKSFAQLFGEYTRKQKLLQTPTPPVTFTF
jgi:hypothetical protein